MFRRFLFLVALLLPGCKDKEPLVPTTYPVSGKVLYKDGTPMRKGMINFRSVTDASVSADGIVSNDGTFTLTTLTQAKQKSAGAIEGEHRVTIIFMVEDQVAARPPDPLTLKETYKILPQESNQIEIKIDRPK